MVEKKIVNFEKWMRDVERQQFQFSFTEVEKDQLFTIIKDASEYFREKNISQLIDNDSFVNENFHSLLMSLNNGLEQIITSSLTKLVENFQFLNTSECPEKIKFVNKELRLILQTSYRTLISVCNLFDKSNPDELAIVMCCAVKNSNFDKINLLSNYFQVILFLVTFCPMKRIELALAWNFYDLAEEFMIEDDVSSFKTSFFFICYKFFFNSKNIMIENWQKTFVLKKRCLLNLYYKTNHNSPRYFLKMVLN